MIVVKVTEVLSLTWSVIIPEEFAFVASQQTYERIWGSESRESASYSDLS